MRQLTGDIWMYSPASWLFPLCERKRERESEIILVVVAGLIDRVPRGLQMTSGSSNIEGL